MYYQFIQPTAALAPFIKHYWVLETEPSDGCVTERVVPTANIELLFHYKTPFLVTSPNKATSLQPQTLLSGFSNSFSDASTQGESGVIAVDFHPCGACNFFRFQLSEAQNQNIGLTDIFSNEVRAVEDQLCTLHTLKQRVEVVEQFLMSKLKPINPYDFQLIKHGVQLIIESSGNLQSPQLAEKLSVSTRNLERKFSTFVGVTPKQFAKVVRFHEVLNGLTNGSAHYLTEYAYNNGYFDQSHFIKEFKAFSGFTPSEYLKHYPCNSLTLNSQS